MTEWDEPLIRDCVYAGGVMLANKATLGAIACTRAQREALARAAGKPEGQEASTLADLATGMRARYGWSGNVSAGPGVAQLLGPTIGAVVIGWYAKLPAHYQRFDRTFAAKGSASLHAIYAEHRPELGATDRWMIDPLFHAEPGYTGERVTVAALTAYATGFGGPVRAMVAAEGSQRGSIGPMNVYERTNEAGTFTIEPGKAPAFYRLGATGWEVVKTWTARATPSSASFAGILRRVAGTASPAAALHVTTGFGAGLYVSASWVTEHIVAPPAPPPDAVALARAGGFAAAKGRAAAIVGGAAAAVAAMVDPA